MELRVIYFILQLMTAFCFGLLWPAVCDSLGLSMEYMWVGFVGFIAFLSMLSITHQKVFDENA